MTDNTYTLRPVNDATDETGDIEKHYTYTYTFKDGRVVDIEGFLFCTATWAAIGKAGEFHYVVPWAELVQVSRKETHALNG